MLTLFFIDRLKDHHSIQPQVIYGLLGLVSYFTVSDQNIIGICQAIFAEVHVRSLVQADRRNIFNLFSNVLEKYLRPVRRMEADFVLGFIQSMDGEKDPRNLLVCFQNIQQIVSNLQFEAFVEDLFEVTSCYFPIDFTPPPNDPHGISKEDLVLQLRKCLASTHFFGPLCVPLLLEKISSDIIDAKIDAYLTFAACAKVYKPVDINVYCKDLWKAVRGDYLLGGIMAIESACMDALEGAAICLSSKHEMCKEYVELVLYDCEQALKDPDLNLQYQLSKIVIAIVFSCNEVFEMTFPQIIRLLGSLLNDNQSKANSTAILQILHQLLQHPYLGNQSIALLNFTFASEKSIIAYLLASLSGPDPSSMLVCYSFECLLVLLFHGCLSESDKSIFFDSLIQGLDVVTEGKTLHTLFKCISVICERNLEPTPQFVCSKLHMSIKNVVVEQYSGDAVGLVKIRNTLDALYLTLKNIDHAVSIACKLIEDFPFNDLGCIHVEVLKFVIQVINNFPQAAGKLESKIIPMLLQILENRMTDVQIWDVTVALLRTVISNLSHQSQSLWINQLVSRFILEQEHFHERALSDSKQLYLISSFLCAARGSVDIIGLQDVIKWLQQEVLEAQNSLSVEYICKCYASLINKMPEGIIFFVNYYNIHLLWFFCHILFQSLQIFSFKFEMAEPFFYD